MRDPRGQRSKFEFGVGGGMDDMDDMGGMSDLSDIGGILSATKRIGAVLILAGAAAACSTGLTEVGSINLLPRVDGLARPDWLTYSGGKNEFTLRPVTAVDLVNAEGQCAATEATPVAAPEADGTPAPAPLQPGGIALQMTECDVVRRAGAPERLEIGAARNGDREVVITYIRGPRPGIYRFVAGRLASVERSPEAPAARAPKAKPAKKPARS